MTHPAAKTAYRLQKEIPRDREGNPKTLEGVLRSMILKNPDSISWRDDALNILYCVLGSGIRWNQTGRLVDISPNNYMNLPPDVDGYGIWAQDFGLDESLLQMNPPQEVIDRLRKHRLRDLRDAVQTVEEIDLRQKTYRPGRTHWYPISWYECHLCCPENAQEDFFWGAIETCHLILNLDIDALSSNYWHGHHRSQNVVREILPVLEARNPER